MRDMLWGLWRVVSTAAFLTALAFLGVVAGGLVVLRDLQPLATVLKQTNLLVSALYFDFVVDAPDDRRWWPVDRPLPADGVSIVTYDKSLTQDGINLVMAAEASTAQLVAMDGRILHRWHLPFLEAWPVPAHVPNFRRDSAFYWRRVHLFANGDLLAIYESADHTPYGLGLVKVDKDSNLIWKLPEHTHHDITVGEDGYIYALSSEIDQKGYEQIRGMSAPFLKDSVIRVSPDGKVVGRWHIIDAFLNSPYAPMLYRMDLGNSRGDLTHANALQYIDEDTASKFPFAKAGQLLISLREMDTIAILDPETGSIMWAMAGMWRRQHEPQFLGNGNMLIFDNQGHMGEGGISRVLEFDPVTGVAEWIYAGTKDQPLETTAFGTQQRLSNGNTLITDSHNGRAIEVTPGKKIVWEYRHPVRKVVDGQQFVTITFDVRRLDPDTLTFLDVGAAN